MLGWCYKCKENSVVRRMYQTRSGSNRRIEYCINKGCKYRKVLSYGNVVSQTVHTSVRGGNDRIGLGTEMGIGDLFPGCGYS